MTQDWSLTPAAPPPSPPIKGRGLLISGLVLLGVAVLAFVAGLVGIVGAASSLVSGFSSPRMSPASIAMTLDAGTTYAVYEAAEEGSGTSGDPFTTQLTAQDITITGPGGVVVTPRDTGSSTQTYTTRGTTFVAGFTFDPPTSGAYTISITATGVDVVVAPSLTAFGRVAVWGALLGLGALIGLVGVVLLVVGLVRRANSRRAAGTGYANIEGYATPGYVPPAAPAPAPAAPAPAAPPPPPALPPAGWYADPQRPGTQRYWDGTTWTNHVDVP